MLEPMRQWALCHLFRELEGCREQVPDLDQWFAEKRANEGGVFFPYLVESPGKITRYYTLSADPDDPEVAVLEGAELGSLDASPSAVLPFSKPSGPNSAQLGPVIKRSHSKDKGAMPGETILNRTLAAFDEIAASGKPWSAYFREVADVWRRPTLCFQGKTEPADGRPALHRAVEAIPETNDTVFLAHASPDGRLPGRRPEYVEYLLKVLAETKYATKSAPPIEDGLCALCGAHGTTFSSACTGAGINVGNLDRAGAFPGVQKTNSHLGYSLCVDCADLLYVFHYYVEPSLLAPVAGERALVLPHLHFASDRLTRAVQYYADYVESIQRGRVQTSIADRKLPRLLAEEKTVATVDIIWATFGNKMEGIHGQVLEILPTRFRELDEFNNRVFRRNTVAVGPERWVEEVDFNLNLSFLRPLFRRPGGKAAQGANASSRLRELKRAVAAAIYRRDPFPAERFEEELLTTARWYLLQIIQDNAGDFGLINEGYSESKDSTWLTLAGWVRHLAVCRHYLKELNVMKKDASMTEFEPTNEKLKELFEQSTGIDSDEKAFAFVLGLLLGRAMFIQSMKGVSVAANALTWLKRLNLTGADLPELHNKIRGKLLQYQSDPDTAKYFPKAVFETIEDVARLGNAVGDEPKLNKTSTCYFLLLGQALSTRVFKKETAQD